MSMIDDDGVSNLSGNETIWEVADARLSRRRLVAGGVASGVALSGVGSLLDAVPASASGSRSSDGDRGDHGNRPLLGFESIPPSSDDTVHVPPGYTARVLISWGDPVS